MHTPRVYTDCTLATMQAAAPLLENAAFAIENGRISWFGASAEVPDVYAACSREPLEGRLVTPALIDCHTHLVFGGHRAQEFDQRLRGTSYAAIARSGGGIAATVAATRAASDDALLRSALLRLDALIADGVTVVEIKSGYGLTIDDEIRMLRIARRLPEHRPVRVVTTWLAAHALPPEYAGRPDDYLDEVALPGLHIAHRERLVDAVDGFCETIAFQPNHIRRVFDAAAGLGLPVKLHAEQLSDQKGALLVAEYGGLSADHLEYLDERDVPRFAASGAVAVLLPGAFYTLQERQRPPVEAMREHGVPLAVATDCNPGSSPLTSLRTAMNMACVLYGLTPEEALMGVTRHAATALGLQDTHGRVAGGRPVDLAVWNLEHPRELSYWQGGQPLYRRIHGRGTP
ncbi:MAG: imidazolonepropionase [Myxococcota bacterium]